jgi:DNA-binding transcriptional regulator YhcF (GntR family)
MATRNLSLEIDRNSGMPLYIQIKHQIGSLISAQIWENGFKLPTERKLAQILGVSRNTISAAYRELQAEGLLLSLQGKGTFVAGEQIERGKVGRKGRLLKVIDLALEEAAELGFSPDDFLTLATTRALERKKQLEIIDVAFIGSCIEQACYFKHELATETGLKISPFLLQEIENDPITAKENLKLFDLIVTTLFDIDKLQALIHLPDIPVLGIALELELETVVQIARLPRNSTLALICSTNSFISTVKQSLCKAGIDGLDLQSTTSTEEQLTRIITQSNAIAVSINRITEALRWAQKGMQAEIIKLKYRVDHGSLNMLRCYLADLRNRI